MNNITKKSLILILVVLLVDQLLKIYIKTNYTYNQITFLLGLDWARLHFVENKGMAFGWEIDWTYGKLLLSLFRIVAISLLFVYIKQLIKEGFGFRLVSCFVLILAGAIGNMIDSAFYGLIFNESLFSEPAQWTIGNPDVSGYAGFLHGRVVDMFHFPIINGTAPEWMPFIGGEHVEFFKPIFNVADAAISIGVFNLIAFNFNYFKSTEEPKGTEETMTSQEEASE